MFSSKEQLGTAFLREIRVGIIESDFNFAQTCVHALLKSESISEANVFLSIESFEQSDPEDFDIVFLDTVQSGKSGIQFLREKRNSERRTKYVMLSDSGDSLFQAIRAGAVGFVLKKDLRDINEVVDMVIREGGVLSPGSAAKMISFLHKPRKQELYSLSPREREILEHIVRGSRTKQIANYFGTKEGTVRIQIKSIFKKLQVNSRIDLVRKFSGLSGL